MQIFLNKEGKIADLRKKKLCLNLFCFCFFVFFLTKRFVLFQGNNIFCVLWCLFSH